MAERRGLDGSLRHDGEQAVQEQAGEGGTGWGSPMFDGEISPSFALFIQAQPMLFASAADPLGRVWSTLLAGGPGFVEVHGQRMIVIHCLPRPGDGLVDAFGDVRDIGLIFIDFERRRRIRVNGQAVRDGESLVVTTTQVLGNCPKYISRRRPFRVGDGALGAYKCETGAHLTDQDQTWIAEADTFFVGSLAAPHGADCSHRGGAPGFVTAAPDVVSWPDYVGNSFYMTFGNLLLNASCGLLFVRWESGDLLQVTGHGRLNWDSAAVASKPGGLRMAEVSVAGVRRISNSTSLRWTAVG